MRDDIDRFMKEDARVFFKKCEALGIQYTGCLLAPTDEEKMFDVYTTINTDNDHMFVGMIRNLLDAWWKDNT